MRENDVADYVANFERDGYVMMEDAITRKSWQP